MSIVPDLISHEAVEKAFFSILGAVISGLSGIVGWFGHVITQWWLTRRRTALSVRFVQDLVSGVPNLWSRTQVGGRTIMQLSAHFRITNSTEHPVFVTQVATGFWRRPVVHPRVTIINPEEEVIRDNPIPPNSTRDATLAFELDPPRRWSGRHHLYLHITDSLGNERRVRTTFWSLDAQPRSSEVGR